MPKRALVAGAIAAILVASFFAGGHFLSAYSTAIDHKHWTGFAIPPCFRDASRCAGHVLGTDEVGRDELARLIVGGRTTIGASLLALAVEIVTAFFLGAAARYGGKGVRFAVRRVAAGVASFAPWPVVAVVALLYLDRHARPTPLSDLVSIVAAGIVLSPRLIAKSFNGRSARAAFDQAAKDWGSLILLLSTVDFFGLGIQPPTASWGNMLANMQANVAQAWWETVFPGVCIALAVLLIELGRRSIFARRA